MALEASRGLQGMFYRSDTEAQAKPRKAPKLHRNGTRVVQTTSCFHSLREARRLQKLALPGACDPGIEFLLVHSGNAT